MSFIRKKKVKGHEYAMEVENYRVDGKVRQRILRYMGRADADKPASPKWITKKTNAIVKNNGMAHISISRKLKGKRVPIEYRYRMPDQSCNPTPGTKKEKKVSVLSPDLKKHLEESFKHNDSVLKRLAQM